MARSSVLILILVVMCLVAICESRVGDGGQELVQDSISGSNRLDLAAIIPDIEQLTRAQAMKTRLQRLDEDHSNIELQRLNEANRYEILPAASLASTSDIRSGDAYSLASLFSKMRGLNRGNELTRSQIERKRSIRQLAATEEDKDYSFAGAPMNKYSGQRAADSKWAAQKLRDMILANVQSFRYATEDNNLNPEQRSQVLKSVLSFNGPINDNSGDANDLMPKNREKRRRCKVDPNLGVKNPSFCDTDAYFGAADYSMRDVWDSAGRRR